MPPFKFEVQIPDSEDVSRTHDEIDWLIEQGLYPSIDFSIDMHGGRMRYSSFFFKSRDQALLFKLTRGGK